MSKKVGGAENIRKRGDKGILVVVTPEQHEQLKTAAGIAGIPMSHFVRDAAVAHAEEVIARFKKG